jgi:hypothetical protein
MYLLPTLLVPFVKSADLIAGEKWGANGKMLWTTPSLSGHNCFRPKALALSLWWSVQIDLCQILASTFFQHATMPNLLLDYLQTHIASLDFPS